MIRNSLPLVLLIILVGCAGLTKANNAVMDSWRGAERDRLIEIWGEPDLVVEDKEGRTTLVYEREAAFLPTPESAPFDPAPVAYKTKRLFHVNAEGIIDDWTWEGW